MRKLVKKLALVLALVLAIGCIAPASAQAAEGVRRSWNFAPGEFKPTLNLTVDQSYTLEALDYEAAMDYSIYDVAYYSYNTDALEVSMETGYAVAKAAAKNVKIKAVVLNKETGNTATFWGFVDIAEKEVVATATPTATVAPTEAPLALVSAEQTATNQLVLTFNKDVTKTFKKADLSVKYSKTEDGKAKYNCYIKGTPTVDGETVTVDLYTTIKADTFVFATYANCGTQTFKASSGKPVRLEVITTEAAASEDGEETPIKFALYDEKEIKLATYTTSDVPNNISCEVTLEGNVVDGETIADASTDGIVFYKMNQTVCVIVKCEIDAEDEDEDEIELEGYGEVSSIDTKTIVKGAVWSATTKEAKDSKDAKWGDNKVYIGDTGWRVAGKVTLTLPRLDGNDKDVVVYTEQVAKEDNRYVIEDIDLMDLVYESSDTSVLLVDSEGCLIPVKEGTAEIIVRLAPYDDEDGNEVEGDVIGVHEIRVLEEKEFTSLKVTADKEKISNGAEAHERVTFTITGYDQHGNEFDLKPIVKNFKLVSLDKDEEKAESIIDNFTSAIEIVKSDKNTLKCYLYAYDETLGESFAECTLKKGTYKFAVKYNEDIITSNNISVSVANVDEDSKIGAYVLAGGTSVDMKVQKSSKMKTDIRMTLNALTSRTGYLIDTMEFDGRYDKTKTEEDGVEAGSFWYDVTLPYGGKLEKEAFFADERVYVYTEEVKDDKSSYMVDRLVFVPYVEGKELSTGAPESLPTGEYVFTVYRFNGSKYEEEAKTSVIIKNGQETLTSKVEKLVIDGSYKTLMAGITVNADKSFEATTVTGQALIDALIKEHYDNDSKYCVTLWDGKTEINDAETYKSHTVVGVVGYTDNKKITVTTIKVEKRYSGTKTVYDVAVNAGFTFSEE